MSCHGGISDRQCEDRLAKPISTSFGQIMAPSGSPDCALASLPHRACVSFSWLPEGMVD